MAAELPSLYPKAVRNIEAWAALDDTLRGLRTQITDHYRKYGENVPASVEALLAAEAATYEASKAGFKRIKKLAAKADVNVKLTAENIAEAERLTALVQPVIDIHDAITREMAFHVKKSQVKKKKKKKKA
jgi:hypothetical protein